MESLLERLEGLRVVDDEDESVNVGKLRSEAALEDIEVLSGLIRFGLTQDRSEGRDLLSEFRDRRLGLSVTDLVGPTWCVVSMLTGWS